MMKMNLVENIPIMLYMVLVMSRCLPNFMPNFLGSSVGCVWVIEQDSLQNVDNAIKATHASTICFFFIDLPLLCAVQVEADLFIFFTFFIPLATGSDKFSSYGSSKKSKFFLLLLSPPPHHKNSQKVWKMTKFPLLCSNTDPVNDA
jgi:hypothetical protein